MHAPKQKPKAPTISNEQAEFYQALGTLNARLVARVTKDPSSISAVAKWIREAIFESTPHNHCPPGTVENPLDGTCVRNFVDPDDLGGVNPNA
jgi:hypothetical protein